MKSAIGPVQSSSHWEHTDSQVWNAICNWPSHTSFNPVHDKLDFCELTRWFLWDKVARAVRYKINPEEFASEVKSLGWDCLEIHYPKNRVGSIFKKNLQWVGIYFGLAGHTAPKEPYCFQPKSTKQENLPKTVFMPVPSPRLLRTAQSIMMENSVRLIAPESKMDLPSIDRISYPKNVSSPDNEFASKLLSAIVEGLYRQEIVLFRQDVKLLLEEIEKQLIQLQVARRYLEEVIPDAILVHADNHPPHQHYVLLGRNLGIPSIMLQHGLDCEHFYLDHCYADAIAVWGDNRKQRYLDDSHNTPHWMAVTGNPEFDSLVMPVEIDTSGTYWLWATRPHSSSKCYSPSRSPFEGVLILKALLASLEEHPDCSLVIKPHPYDNIDLYEDLLRETESSNRVSIVETPPCELFMDASIVITEDTTVGMEAMFLGKVVVHAHFTTMKPTVDYVGYNAALPAFSKEELLSSMRKASILNHDEQASMLQGQQAFLRTHAGPCDGLATERVRDFILDILDEI